MLDGALGAVYKVGCGSGGDAAARLLGPSMAHCPSGAPMAVQNSFPRILSFARGEPKSGLAGEDRELRIGQMLARLAHAVTPRASAVVRTAGVRAEGVADSCPVLNLRVDQPMRVQDPRAAMVRSKEPRIPK